MTDRLPLVLFAIPELDAGGPDRVVFELLSSLPRDRYRVGLVVQNPGGRYFDQLPDDVCVHVLDSRSRYPIFALARVIRKVRPAILLSTLRMNVTAGLARSLFGSTKLVARQANAIAMDFAVLRKTSWIKHRLAEHVVGFALRQADSLVAQSRDMAGELRREARKTQLVATIGNPVDVAEIDRAASIQREIGLPTLCGAPAILAVGRLMPQKGYNYLIAAMPAVLAAYPAAHLTILGEGVERAALEAQIDAAELHSSVTLAGQSSTVFAHIQVADLIVSSSRYEGFSNAILEAMALGATVAATDCPGATSELIRHGQTGFLCPPDNAPALAACIVEALKSDRAFIGAASRDFVTTVYDRSIIADRYTELFDRVLAN